MRLRATLAIGLISLLFPMCSASQEKHDRFLQSPITRAQAMLRALYPQLAGKSYQMSVTTFGSFDIPWTLMPPFDVEIGHSEIGRIEITGLGKSSPVTERHPVLIASFQFGADNILDNVYFRSPELTLNLKNDQLRKLVDSHQEWSDQEVAAALKNAGAKFGPNEREQVLKALPLSVLEPFIGLMEIDSAEFRMRHQQKPASLAQFILGRSRTFQSWRGTLGRMEHYF
jgi:hypothetical protein